MTVLWSGPDPAANLGNDRSLSLTTVLSARGVLGSEFDVVIMDALKGFDCDTFAALAGTITGGGMLLLLTPELEQWRKKSRFLHRFVSLLYAQTEVLKVPAASVQTRLLSQPDADQSFDRLQQQNRLLAELTATVADRLKHGAVKVTLLSADRGRGKSAALGIFLARTLCLPKPPSVLVSAPSKRAVNVLYRHFNAARADNPLAEPRFCPPDQLLTNQADLLIVDEAAGIPLSLLRAAASRYRHVIFASTIHGYEGAGRGFSLRFAQLLRRDNIKLQQLTMHRPVRWLEGDPIEAFCHQALLLDAPLPALPTAHTLEVDTLHCRYIPAKKLSGDDVLLRQVYGLLIQAHYRTTPSDLQHLLDGDNLKVFALFDGELLVAAALLAEEGPFHDLSLRQAILASRRRPFGHLLPQLLAQYTMIVAALDVRFARIVRIAVHPQLQGRGIGSRFLHELELYCCNAHIEVLGAMFGAVPDTVRFWQKNGFDALHLGFRRQSSSGYRSLTVGKTVSSISAKISTKTQLHEKNTTPVQPAAQAVLARASLLHEDIERFHAAAAVDHHRATGVDLSAAVFDDEVLQRYALGQRTFNDTHAALARLYPRSKSLLLHSPEDHKLLRCCLSPDASIASVSVSLKHQSKSDTEQRLRAIIEHWLDTARSRQTRRYPANTTQPHDD